MSIFESNKDQGLNVNARPGNLNVRGQQPTLFPFDAFEFTNPNEDPDVALLRLKNPWQFEIEPGSGTGAQQTLADIGVLIGDAQTSADESVTYPELEQGYESGVALVAPTLLGDAYMRVVTLQWDRQSAITNLAYYEVQRKRGDGGYEIVAGDTTVLTVESYTDAPVLDEVGGYPIATEYTYRVRRVKSDGVSSDWSNELVVSVAPTTNADIAAAAVNRAQMETAFVNEHTITVDEIYPAGVGGTSAITTLEGVDASLQINIDSLDAQVTPRIDSVTLHNYNVEALVEAVIGEVTTAEDAILIRATEIDLIVGEVFENGLGSGSRISLTEDTITSAVARIDVAETNLSLVRQQADLIEQIVSEIDVGDGNTINISSITQTAEQIELVVTSGTYRTEGGSIEQIYSQAQIEALSDQIELFVADGTWGVDTEGNPLRATVVDIYPTGFTAEVTAIADQSVVDSGLADEISAARSVIDIASDRALIASEISESIEDQLYTSIGWIEATGRQITLAVEALDAEDARIASELTLTASEINAQVSSIDADLQASKASVNIQDDAIKLLALQGLYDNNGEIIVAETQAQLTVLSDQIELFVADGSWDGVDATAIEQNASGITIAAGRLNGHDVDISQNGSLIEFNRDLIALRTQVMEDLDGVTYEYAAAIEARGREITLTAEQFENDVAVLQTSITQTAEQIELEAIDRRNADTLLQSNIVQRADAVSVSVRENSNVISGLDTQLTALDAELVVQADAISQRVRAHYYDFVSESWVEVQNAFTQLGVDKLPLQIEKLEYQAWETAFGGTTNIDAVYEGEGVADGEGYYSSYGVSAGATALAIEALKGLLRPLGLLKTQFLVSADDIIFDGSVTASHIAADTITATEIAANTITAAEIAASTITAAEINVTDLIANSIVVGTGSDIALLDNSTAGYQTGAEVQTIADAAEVAAETAAALDATAKANAAKDALAIEMGYTNFADIATVAATRGSTLITGGYLSTDFIKAGAITAAMIDVENLFAATASITGNLTLDGDLLLGTLGEITTSGFVVGGGAEVLAEFNRDGSMTGYRYPSGSCTITRSGGWQGGVLYFELYKSCPPSLPEDHIWTIKMNPSNPAQLIAVYEGPSNASGTVVIAEV